MPTTLWCVINKHDGSGYVNYGPAGRDELMDVELTLGGIDVVGSGQITLKTAHIIPGMSEIMLFLSDGATMSTIYMGGFAGNVEVWFPNKKAVAAQRRVTIDVVDYNVLLDGMGLPYGDYVSDNGSTDFDTQLTRIERYLTTGAYVTDTININNALSGAVSRFGNGSGFEGDKSWRQLMEDRCNAATEAGLATRANFFMSATSFSATRLVPQLEVFDAGNLSAAGAIYTFHDGTSTTPGAIAVEAFRYTKDSGTQETYVKAWSQNAGFFRSSEARSAGYATYENPYNVRSAPVGGTWFSKSYKLEDNLSTGQVADARDRILGSKENPRLTFEVDVSNSAIASPNEPRPGRKVLITWDTESLLDEPYYIAESRVKWRFNQLSYPVFTLQVGNRILGLGEEDAGATGRVVERDRVRPQPPTNFAVTYQPAGEDWVMARFTWTASTSTDVIQYEIYGTIDGQGVAWATPKDSNPVPTSMDVRLRATARGTVYCGALDDDGNRSLHADNPSITITASDTEGPPTDELLNPNFALVDLYDTTKPAYWFYVAGAGTWERAIPNAAQTLKGEKVLHLQCDVGETITIQSSRVAMYNPSTTGNAAAWQMLAACRYYTANTSGVFSLKVQPYKTDGTPMTLITAGSVNLATGTLDGSLSQGNVTPDAQTAYGRLQLILDNSAGSATCDLYISACILEPSTTSPRIGTLDVQTNPIVQTDSSGGTRSVQQVSGVATELTEYDFYDALAALMGRLLSYVSGSDKYIKVATATGVGFWVKASDGVIKFESQNPVLANGYEIESRWHVMTQVINGVASPVYDSNNEIVMYRSYS